MAGSGYGHPGCSPHHRLPLLTRDQGAFFSHTRDLRCPTESHVLRRPEGEGPAGGGVRVMMDGYVTDILQWSDRGINGWMDRMNDCLAHIALVSLVDL